MSTTTLQISYAPESEILFQMFFNHLVPCSRPLFYHSHPDYEILVVTSGRGEFTVDKTKVYDFQPGDVFIIRGNEDHKITFLEPGESIHNIGVHFLPQFIISENSNLFDIRYLRVFLNHDKVFDHRLPRNTPATEEIFNLMEQIKREEEIKQPDYELMIKVKLMAILVEINRNYQFASDDELLKITNDHYISIETSMQYIDEHLVDDLSIDKLALIANMSISYYSHIFKLVNRISPLEYIIRKRLDLAMNALRTTDASVLSIAYSCGFNNTANFNKAFKKRTGIVPSSFRKQSRMKDFGSLMDIM